MKRGQVLRVKDDNTAEDGIAEAVAETFRRLVAEAHRHSETPKLETLKIECKRDFSGMFRVEGTLESTPKPPEYSEIMEMYLETLYETRAQGGNT